MKGILLEFLELVSSFCNPKGRLRRRAYWIGVLELTCVYVMFVNVVMGIFMATAVGEFTNGTIHLGGLFAWSLDLISIIYMLFLIPATVRRLHDIGKGSAVFLLLFVPFANIYVMILLCLNSKAGENRFGPYPKDPEYDRYADKPIRDAVSICIIFFALAVLIGGSCLAFGISGAKDITRQAVFGGVEGLVQKLNSLRK